MVSSAASDAPPRIVALMASYRSGRTIDRITQAVLEAAREAGAVTDEIRLAEAELAFCTNCRACTLRPGPERGRCVLHDDVNGILDRMEAADGLVLAASVNTGDVNAMTRALLERMIGYVHWPDGAPAPVVRRPKGKKPALLVTSSAAPAILARTVMRPLGTLSKMARLLGARPVGSLLCGLAGRAGDVPPRLLGKARERGARLARRAAEARR